MFSPQKIGLTSTKNKNFFELRKGKGKERKLIAWFVYHDFMNPPYWMAYTVNYHENNTSISTPVFKGNIPDNDFAKQLLKNIIL
jgi:hypothetical protein